MGRFERGFYIEDAELHPNAKKIAYTVRGKCLIVVSHTDKHRSIPVIRRGGGRVISMRRYIYECEVGPVERGQFVHMDCGNAYCIHPKHMVARRMRDTRRHSRADRERALYLSERGIPHRKIGKALGMSIQTIWRIRKSAGVISSGGTESSQRESSSP